MTSFEFDPSGEFVAASDRIGTCVIAEINTNKPTFHKREVGIFGGKKFCSVFIKSFNSLEII